MVGWTRSAAADAEKRAEPGGSEDGEFVQTDGEGCVAVVEGADEATIRNKDAETKVVLGPV
jgi:hypothetical protein